jgi:tRNA uridine 5-carboxymethylaminomethyl modification enzyme
VGSAELKDSQPLSLLVRRPELALETILEKFPYPEPLAGDLVAALEVELKFSGYLRRQEEEIEKLKAAEGELIPAEFSYDSVPSLRIEIREKLKKVRPYSLGQAMRIPGITPSALSLLAVHLKRHSA